MDGIKTVADCGMRIAECGGDLRSPSARVDAQSKSAQGCEDEKRRLARDFESVLLARLFDQVKDSIGQWNEDDEEDGASEQVHGLFWHYLAEDTADKGGFGLWRDIYQHFKNLEASGRAGELTEEGLYS